MRLFADVAATSARVAATSRRNEKIGALAELLGRLTPDEVPVAVAMLSGAPRQGRIGVGWRTLQRVDVEPAPQPSLTIGAVDSALTRLAALGGDGVVAARRELLRGLFAVATHDEQQLLWRLLGGELHQGANEGVMVAAVARAAAVPLDALRRAHMLAGDLGVAATAALTGGVTALEAVGLTPGIAVQPMLAAPATDVADALTATGIASVEWKLDGARLQAHRRGGNVHLFTRNLNDVTARLPAVVELVAALPGGDVVLDGEVLGVSDDGAPRRFQDTMGDFGAEAPSGRGGGLSAFFFDILHGDGTSLVDQPLATRRDALADVVPEQWRLPSLVTADVAAASAFLDGALAAGHEGVVVKAIDSAYDAGRRGGSWRKVKPVHTLDLVVLAAEWGHGRRHGWLSNLHLGARGDSPGEYLMVGKTFKGMTDELLAWQTERLQQLAIGTEASDVEASDTEASYVVHVRPELVVEIALDGVQVSRRYPGGVALRFARVRRYRPDKRPADADHIDAVRGLLR